MVEVVFRGPRPAGGLELALSEAGANIGEGIGQAFEQNRLRSARQDFLQNIVPQPDPGRFTQSLFGQPGASPFAQTGGTGPAPTPLGGGQLGAPSPEAAEQFRQEQDIPQDPRQQVLSAIQANPDILLDENAFNQILASLQPREPEQEPERIRELRAAGVDPASPEGREALLRSRGAIEDQPEVVTLRKAAENLRAQGDERTAELLDRQAEQEAGKSLEQIRAEARARQAGTEEARLAAQQLAQAAGVQPEARDEFNRNLQRLVELENASQTDTTEYRLLAQRIARQTQGSGGVNIEFDEQGNLLRLNVGGAGGAGQGLASQLTGQQALREQAQLDTLDTTIDRLDQTIQAIEERPGRAGVVRGVRSFVENLTGFAQDALAEVGLEPLTERVKESIAAIPGLTDEEAGEFDPFFDPELTRTEIFQNTIAFELAKLRINSGGGSVRALKDAFDVARQDVQLGGLQSSRQVVSRLQTIRDEFVTAREQLRQRLSGRRDLPERRERAPTEPVTEAPAAAAPQAAPPGGDPAIESAAPLERVPDEPIFGRFRGASLEDLLNVDVTELNSDELTQLEAAFDRMEGVEDGDR